jgi:type I restriction enzyme S subunit
MTIELFQLSKFLLTMESGKRPAGGAVDHGVPSLGGEHVNADGTIKLKPMKYVPDEFYRTIRKGLVKKNDILVVKDGATTGKVGYIDEDFPFQEAAINEHLFLLRANPERALSKFLYYLLRSENGKAQILLDFRGAAQGGISKGFVDRVMVPNFSLDEQKRIVDILSNAENIVFLRKKSLRVIQELKNSIFNEKFGDIAINSKKWPVMKVAEFVEKFEGGKNLLAGSEGGSSFRILKVSAVTSGEYDESESKPSPDNYMPPDKHLVKTGDLLFSRANTLELVGATALVRSTNNSTLLPDKLWRFVWKIPMESVYVNALFQTDFIRGELGKLSSGTSASMRNISQEKLFNMTLPVAPYEIQKEFTETINRIDEIKDKNLHALEKSEEFFKSVLDNSFANL